MISIYQMVRNKKIAVLLTCHNRYEKTLNCLNALFMAILPERYLIKVYLVDDGSTDRTGEVVREMFPEVNVIQGSGNLFWTRGMYLAWTHAAIDDFDFYLWLNDDTLLKQNSLLTILENTNAQNNESIIVGVCKSNDDSIVTYGGYYHNSHKIIEPNGQVQKCYFFNGNVVLIPQKVFSVVGYIDPVFQHGFGDYDYGLRARKMGINSYVTSQPIGFCDKNELNIWCNPDYTILKRIKHFYSPLGMAPFQHFIYARRHFGVYKALKKILSQHLRLLIPSLWLNNK